MATYNLPRPISIGLSTLSVIGLVLWTAGTFLGLYFFSGGSYGISIPLSLAVGGLMGMCLYMMIRYTRLAKKTDRREQSRRNMWLFLAIYAVLSLGTVCFVMHSVAVSTNIKNDYRAQAVEDLRNLYVIVDKNAPAGSYPEYVNKEVERYRQGNQHKDPSTLNVECNQLRERLEKSSGFDNLHDAVATYWQEADATVRDWQLLYLPSTANTLHDRQQQWVDSVRVCANAGKFDRYALLHNEYVVTFAPKADLYSMFRSIGVADFSGWCIPLVLLLQILILGIWAASFSGGKEHIAIGVREESWTDGGAAWPGPDPTSDGSGNPDKTTYSNIP